MFKFSIVSVAAWAIFACVPADTFLSIHVYKRFFFLCAQEVPEAPVGLTHYSVIAYLS